METKIYYVDGSIKANREALSKVTDIIPCFFQSTLVEMDYIECIFEVRQEDVATLEKYIAPLV